MCVSSPDFSSGLQPCISKSLLDVFPQRSHRYQKLDIFKINMLTPLFHPHYPPCKIPQCSQWRQSPTRCPSQKPELNFDCSLSLLPDIIDFSIFHSTATHPNSNHYTLYLTSAAFLLIPSIPQQFTMIFYSPQKLKYLKKKSSTPVCLNVTPPPQLPAPLKRLQCLPFA